MINRKNIQNAHCWPVFFPWLSDVYKRQQLEELEAQRKKEMDELAEERNRLEQQQAESQRIMAELLRLKNELSGFDAEKENTGNQEKE